MANFTEKRVQNKQVKTSVYVALIMLPYQPDIIIPNEKKCTS